MSRFPIFNQVENTRLKYNIFDLSHDKKLSCKMGMLIPIQCIDLIPGDQFKIQSSALVRLAPTIAPFMHRVNVFIHHFFVPNRILWDNWEDFITGGKDGGDNSVHPYYPVDCVGLSRGSLFDYLGIPVGSDAANTENREINAFPLAVYQAIFEEYYNDQNVGNTVDYELVDGNNIANTDLDNIRYRCWEHDYLTSALPWTQRGPEAMLPLTGDAPVVVSSSFPVTQLLRKSTTGAAAAAGAMSISMAQMRDGASSNIYLDPAGTLSADLSAVSSTSIIELRRAFRLQEWLEKSARGGARYTEMIKVHFGVDSSDKRLQRPEYIGGSKTPIKISEVLNTSATASSPQGNRSGHAVSVGGGQSFSYRAEEHGYIMSIMSILPESAYQQGIPRHFLRKDKFDYYWNEFAHIGEQGIYKDEVMVTGTNAKGEEIWGYTPRYSEYKFMQNTVHGDFRASLDFWHMGRKFAALPNLNYSFMTMEDAEINRVFAVQDGTDNCWCQVINQVEARRPMPIFGTPKF